MDDYNALHKKEMESVNDNLIGSIINHSRNNNIIEIIFKLSPKKEIKSSKFLFL